MYILFSNIKQEILNSKEGMGGVINHLYGMQIILKVKN